MTRLLEDMWNPPGPREWRGRLLLPLARAGAGLFRLGVEGRRFLYRSGILHPERAPIPILSIGGIEAGGVGKTPLALELLRLAVRAGLAPAILTRGYGSNSSGRAEQVSDPASPAAARRYGDEPVWLAESAVSFPAPVWVARHRLHAARAAAAAGVRFGILDDGLQHWRLARDGEVVCLSGRAPLGNGRLLPAGPLREPAAQALARADRVVLTGVSGAEAAQAAAIIAPLLRPSTEIYSWWGRPGLHTIGGVPVASGEAVCLLAGIAHPERLRASLEALGHPVARTLIFPDHHWFSRQDLMPLLAAGSTAKNRPVAKNEPAWVVTEKDWVRLRASEIHGALRLSLLRQTVVWNEPEAEARWVEWMREIAARRTPELDSIGRT